jgi:hypothetical protein
MALREFFQRTAQSCLAAQTAHLVTRAERSLASQRHARRRLIENCSIASLRRGALLADKAYDFIGGHRCSSITIALRTHR